MENRGIDFGYGFLSQESSFDVQFSLIEYDGSHSYFRAYLVGLLNTILVSVIGIILATILGVLVGIARLSIKKSAGKNIGNITADINKTVINGTPRRGNYYVFFSGKALKAAKYQKNICSNNGMFLKNST